MKIDLGIIPARSGSKGLKNKNLKKIGDLTLLESAVKGLLESDSIRTIVVTSDSPAYLDSLHGLFSNEINTGSLILHQRPEEHARDNSEVDAMLISLVNELKESGLKFETLGLFYPTSPLRNSLHVKEAVSLFFEKEHKSLLSVETFSDYVWKLVNQDFAPVNYDPMNRVSRQYHKSKYFRENKAIYLFYLEDLISFSSRLTPNPGYYLMSKFASIDVDIEEDLIIANLILGFEN